MPSDLSGQPVPRAAYIHVPFCVHRCGYCDFTVVAGREDLIPAYLEALELELRRELIKPHAVETLFLGGGTPTRLSAKELEQLLNLLAEWLPLNPGGEYSIEANPGNFYPDQMAVLKLAGVNRISLGVQSFRSRELQLLERDHTAEDVSKVFSQLREAGFQNIGIDLIYGVPGQSLSDWNLNLELALQLEPEHVSTYGLTFEKGTTYWGRLIRGNLQRVDEELERSMYGLAMDRLPAAGLLQYELSNYAKPGFASRHNQVYWNAQPYFGFGPGAAAFDAVARHVRHRSTTTWIRRTLAGQCGVMESEQLSPDLHSREAIMLGLRKIEGICKKSYQQRFGYSVRDVSPQSFDAMQHTGWLEETRTHVRLTREGRFVADTVMAEFLA